MLVVSERNCRAKVQAGGAPWPYYKIGAFCHSLSMVTGLSLHVLEPWGASDYTEADLWIVAKETIHVVCLASFLEAGYPWADSIWARNQRPLRSLEHRVGYLAWFTPLLCHLLLFAQLRLLNRNTASSARASNLNWFNLFCAILQSNLSCGFCKCKFRFFSWWEKDIKHDYFFLFFNLGFLFPKIWFEQFCWMKLFEAVVYSCIIHN